MEKVELDYLVPHTKRNSNWINKASCEKLHLKIFKEKLKDDSSINLLRKGFLKCKMYKPWMKINKFDYIKMKIFIVWISEKKIQTERWVSVFNFKNPYNQLQKQSVARIMDKVIEKRNKNLNYW